MENQQQQQQQNQQQQYRQIRATIPDSGKKCFHCGAAISPSAVVCPVCGKPVNPNVCTFCGAELDPDDRFCAECGNSRDGHVCPQCGTLNFRSFCRVCNHPLDYMAQEAIAQAQNDPKYQRVLELHRQVQELEKQILESFEYADALAREDEAEAEMDNPEELSEKDQALMAEYESLMSLLQGSMPAPPKQEEQVAPPAQTEAKHNAQRRIRLNVDLDRLEALKQQYTEKVEEMNAALDDMMPDPGMTPQMQTNYYSARQISDNSSFVCTACGQRHKNPAECSEAKSEGKWTYDSPEKRQVIHDAVKKLINVTVSDAFKSKDCKDLPQQKKQTTCTTNGITNLLITNQCELRLTANFSGADSVRVNIPPYAKVTVSFRSGPCRIHTIFHGNGDWRGKEVFNPGPETYFFWLE